MIPREVFDAPRLRIWLPRRFTLYPAPLRIAGLFLRTPVKAARDVHRWWQD
jgi:hypothetical protein